MCSDTRGWSISGFGFLCGKTEEHLANRKQLKMICVPPSSFELQLGRWPSHIPWKQGVGLFFQPFSLYTCVHKRWSRWALLPHPLPSYFYPSLFPFDPQLFASSLFINSPSGEILCSWHVTSIEWQMKLSAIHLPDFSRCRSWVACRVSLLPSFSPPLENQVPVSFRYSSDMGRDSQRHPASTVTCFKILHAISESEQHLGRGLTLLWTRNAWLQGSLFAIPEEWPYRAFALALWEAMWHWATTFSSSGI